MSTVEKTFSVAAELEDGTAKDITVRCRTSSDAFRAVRAMPGVRRVGRVSDASARGGRRDEERVRGRAAEHPAPRSSVVAIGHTISGPRVVLPAPTAGGEQPFKHLQAPPERPRTLPPRAAAPVKPAPQQPRVAAAVGTGPASAAAPEYRIAKSRRRGGKPYLLQRGRWQSVNGKRTFSVELEHGFDKREDAEQHLESLVRADGQPPALERSA